MNRIYRSVWNDKTGTFVAVGENTRRQGKAISSGSGALVGSTGLALKALGVALLLAFGGPVWALPSGGVVSAGGASIVSTPGSTTITQSSQNVAINWQSFNIGAGEAVRFIQPNANAIALNRVLGADPSSLLGSLSANGKVFLVNPNGILFGRGASVNVGGLVASTLAISDSDFMAGRYNFTGSGHGAVVNQGSINADGGYVALLGAQVSNEGVITARLGSVVLAAGTAMTLDVAGDGLLNVLVNQGAVNALVENGGLIQADGGQVLLTARAAGGLLQGGVNNTGVIQAQSVENHNGSIRLMGDMLTGTVNVGGTLDASAPRGGNGGFIETSAAVVNVARDAKVTTVGPLGLTGTWLIDPQDFTIAATGGNISGATLSELLKTNSVVISTEIGTDSVATGTPPVSSRFSATTGSGDINVNDAIAWTAAPDTTTLTLNAFRDVNINAAITATNGNLVACCGTDINVRAAITTSGGSTLLSAGHDVKLWVGSAMTTTNGNIELCAGHDVIVNSKITLTNSGSIPSQSLGLPLGLTLSAGNAATGPGAGGSVFLPGAGDPLRPTVTRSAAPLTDVTINYNPASYAVPTDYSGSFILTGAITLAQHMLVFPDGGNKTYDGTTAATLSGFKSTVTSGIATGVTLIGGGSSTATFDTADVGTNKTITFSGYSLDPTGALTYALPIACCGLAVGKTTANIAPAPLTVTAASVAKIYGETPTLSAFTTAGLVHGETVGSVTETSPGTAATASVAGSPYDIIPSSATGGTFTPSNYTITYVNGVLTVSRKMLVGSITAADKTYDGTSTAAITGRTLAGVLNADVVNYSGGTANFDTPNAGTGKTVTGSGLGLTGAGAGNYTVNPLATTTAAITPVVPIVPIVPISPIVPPVETEPGGIPGGVPTPLPGEIASVEQATPPAGTRLPPGGILSIVPGGLPPQLVVFVPPETLVSRLPEPPVLPPPAVQAPQPVPIVVPVQPRPKVYVTPYHRRKQDRN